MSAHAADRVFLDVMVGDLVAGAAARCRAEPDIM
jgi:hypothetical protein